MVPKDNIDGEEVTAAMAEEWISQTGRVRIVVDGHLAPLGGSCTMLFLKDGDGWLIHPFGMEHGAVRISGSDARRLAERLSAT